MNIETKWGIGDVIKHKYNVFQGKQQYFLLVMEVITQTCYGGLQVFYLTKTIILSKKKIDRFKGDSEYYYEMQSSLSDKDNGNGWRKMREDELQDISEESKEIINELQNKQ